MNAKDMITGVMMLAAIGAVLVFGQRFIGNLESKSGI